MELPAHRAQSSPSPVSMGITPPVSSSSFFLFFIFLEIRRGKRSKIEIGKNIEREIGEKERRGETTSRKIEKKQARFLFSFRLGTIRSFHDTCKSHDPTTEAHFTLLGLPGDLLRVSIFRCDKLYTLYTTGDLSVINPKIYEENHSCTISKHLAKFSGSAMQIVFLH